MTIITEGPKNILHSFTGGYDKNITYLIQPHNLSSVWAVDASVPIDLFPKLLQNKIQGIFITHTHGDHVAYLEQYISKNPNILVYFHKESKFKRSDYKFVPIADSEIIQFEDTQIKVLFTPGHYSDSCCFLMGNIIFTGDTLFIGRTGRTISFGASTRQLYQSINKKILTLPHNTTIFPGHDYGPKPYCTIKENIKISPLLQAENEDDFVLRMEEYESNRLL